ncbi:HAMP domain-containing sensor histidine kinase [uncultured Victivallis sp.]|uniref:sensor histidine kinase n=1 Tax=uncultured Victivallis sp. TaxID=354118 RepID=UPI0025952B2F|nr:HAMP domain-containing sensor histidine kinase [uncultured Victivallis sp.]
MSWSSGFAFFSKLRFKAALWYLVLFAASSVLLFFLVSRYVANDMLRGADWLLESTVRDLAATYLTGKNTARYGQQIPLAEVPRMELAAFRARFPGIRPLIAYRSEVGDQTFHTLFGSRWRELYEFRLESDGRAYSRLLNPEQNLPFLRKEFEDKLQSFGSDNIYFRFRRPDGPAFESNGLRKGGGDTAGSGLSTVEDGRRFRVMTLPLFDGSVIEAGRSLRDMDERLAAYTRLFLVFLAAVLTLGAGAGYLVAWRLTSGIERVSDAARRIADGDLSQRVGAKHESDEIDRLVDAFNAMSENNEALVTELRTVTDDIAHDLRTPLTRIRGMAEVTAAGETSPDGFREMCGAVAEECDSMMQLINEMLEITRTESAIDRLERSEFSLSGLVRQAGALFCEIAEDRNVALAVSVPEQEIAIRADKLKIQRMTANLLDNALKFTPPGGRVELTLALRNGAPVLEVRDTGCGISPAEKEKIFKRFYRCDASRTLPGNGLGLAMVQAIAHAHRARIEVESEPGKGSCFSVIFPQNT